MFWENCVKPTNLFFQNFLNIQKELQKIFKKRNERGIKMVNVKGKWTLIMGASRGIGYHTAKFMAEQGCNLILHSRKTEHCQKLLEEVRALGVEAFSVGAELSDPEQVTALLREVDNLGKNVEIVFNNAGIQTPPRLDFCQTTVEDFTDSFQINIIAPAMICYHFLPKMRENGFGRIINTSSGIHLQPEFAGYAASKAALDKITVDLGYALEGSDVTINLVDPGWCRTDMGGKEAYFPPENAVPGMVLFAFTDDRKSGRRIYAPDFSGMELGEALEKAEKVLCSPYEKL